MDKKSQEPKFPFNKFLNLNETNYIKSSESQQPIIPELANISKDLISTPHSRSINEEIPLKNNNSTSQNNFDKLGEFKNELQIKTEESFAIREPEINNEFENIKVKQLRPNNFEKKLQSVKEARFLLDLPNEKNNLLVKIDSKVINKLDKNKNISQLNPDKSFDFFVTGPSNSVAFITAQNICKNPGKLSSLFYIYSKSGLGKTHLLQAAGNFLQENSPELRVVIVTARDFMKEMVDGILNKRIQDFRKRYSEQVDILMIDDIQELKNKQGTQNELFHIIHEIESRNKQLILTADRPPIEIDGIDEKIKARLISSLIVEIRPPEFETRMEFLKLKAMKEDIYLSEDVLNFIGNNVSDNLRELEGALIRLGAYSSILKVDVDPNIAKEQLKLQIGTENTKILTIEKIALSVSRYYRIPLPDIKSKIRNKIHTEARHVAIFLAYKKLTSSVTNIGKYFNRDHTTVLHAINKIEEQKKHDTDLNQKINIILNTL